MSYSSKTPIKIPSNIDETYDFTPSSSTSSSPMPMQISAKKIKIITQNNEQFNLYNNSLKSQKKKQNLVNMQQ